MYTTSNFNVYTTSNLRTREKLTKILRVTVERDALLLHHTLLSVVYTSFRRLSRFGHFCVWSLSSILLIFSFFLGIL